MLCPDDQQVQICLLKSNLEDIEKTLVIQRSAMPELDAENEQQFRETMTALKVARAQNAEIERLKQENVRLAAKRTELKRQCEAAAEDLEAARLQRSDLAILIKEEEQNDENNIRKYEDSLRDKVERFRNTRSFYNEEEMQRQFEEIVVINSGLEAEVSRRQSVVRDLKQRLESLESDVPEDLPVIVGKMELEKKLELLIKNCEDLRMKVEELSKRE